MRGVEEVLLEEDDCDDRGQEDRDAVEEAPGPGSAPVDDVFLAQARVLGAEEARPRDQAADDEVDEPAEADHHEERQEDRLADALVLLVPEEEIGRGAGQDGDEGGDAGEPAELRGQGDGLLARAQHSGRGRHLCASHGLSQCRRAPA